MPGKPKYMIDGGYAPPLKPKPKKKKGQKPRYRPPPYKEEDQEKRASGPKEEAPAPKPEKPEPKPQKKPSYVHPPQTNLDDEPYPGEPSARERLSGVTGRTPTPKPVQRLGEGLGKLGTAYEGAIGFPSAFIRTRASGTLARAEEAKRGGRDVQAGSLFSMYMAQRAGASLYDAYTSLVRPKVLYETVKTGVGLVVDPKIRKAVVETAKADPGGFTAELGGGLIGSTLLGSTLRKAGIVKPRSYRLRKTTKPREVTSPATLMPTGKYPSGVFDAKLWKTGGTPTLLLKDPGLMTVYEPVPVYKPSLVEPGMGLLSGLRPFTVSKEKPISTVKTYPVTSIPRGYLDVIQKTETLQKPTIRGVTETALILKPVSYTEKKPRPLVIPQIIIEPKPITRTRGKHVQEQTVAQTVKIDYVPVQRTRLKPLSSYYLVEEKKKRRISLRGLGLKGEVRLRPVRTPKSWRNILKG